jgi:hypothetical protein
MIAEPLLFLALALIYVAISYGHSPGDSRAGRQSDMDEENRVGEQRPAVISAAILTLQQNNTEAKAYGRANK